MQSVHQLRSSNAMPLWLSLAILASCAKREPAEVEPPCNVLLVTLDTTRADRLGCYGYGRDTSPELDALARQGILFEHCVATASVTPVSHASILTGRNPYDHGLRVIHAAEGFRLSPHVPTLAELLREKGWTTAAFLSSFTVSEHFGLERGFDHWDSGISEQREAEMFTDEEGRAHWDTLAFQRRSDDTTAAARTWLTAAREPFFAWIHYWDPHDLLVRPPPEILGRFLEDQPGTGSLQPADPPQEASFQDAYDAEVYFVDQQLGSLISQLAADGRLDRTLVAVVSDHGEGLGDHDWRGHRLLYQEQVHVPLVLRLPKRWIGDRQLPLRIPELVRTIDLFPTVLEVLGVTPQGSIEGQSLLPLMRGKGEAPRLAYADQLNLWDGNGRVVELRPEDDLLHCMMDQRFKLIYKPLHPDRSELYDLQSDPAEERNLYAPEHPEAERLLRHLLAREPFVLEDLGAGREIAPSALAALKALGYIDGEAEPPLAHELDAGEGVRSDG